MNSISSIKSADLKTNPRIRSSPTPGNADSSSLVWWDTRSRLSRPLVPPIQGDRIANGGTAKGYETVGRRTPSTGAGIVSFRRPGVDSQAIVRRLKERGIIAAPRMGADGAPFLHQSRRY
jgi:hypothetical protein